MWQDRYHLGDVLRWGRNDVDGIPAVGFAADPRVRGRLDVASIATLESSYDRYPQGHLDDVLASVRALRDAGVDILVGTDAFPLPELGGMAHGASVHHELQLLVQAGLTPVVALRAATSTPARRFGLADRGRILEGLRADLLLVDGDPTRHISTRSTSARSGDEAPRSSRPGHAGRTRERRSST